MDSPLPKKLRKKLSEPSDRALVQQWKERAFSYSQLASWEWDVEEWFSKYILNLRGATTPAMEFGTLVHGGIERPHTIKTTFDGIPLVGVFDFWDAEKKYLREDKTSENPKRWTPETVRVHEQLDMYCALLWLTERLRPEEMTIELQYIPVWQNQSFEYEVAPKEKWVIIPTERTLLDVLQFLRKVKKTRKNMEIFAVEKLLARGAPAE